MVGVGADVHTREAASHTARISTDRADRTAAHTNTIVSHCDGLAKDAKADMHKFVQDMDLPLNSKVRCPRPGWSTRRGLTPCCVRFLPDACRKLGQQGIHPA